MKIQNLIFLISIFISFNSQCAAIQEKVELKETKIDCQVVYRYKTLCMIKQKLFRPFFLGDKKNLDDIKNKVINFLISFHSDYVNESNKENLIFDFSQWKSDFVIYITNYN